VVRNIFLKKCLPHFFKEAFIAGKAEVWDGQEKYHVWYSIL